jgi:hypothetical protein
VNLISRQQPLYQIFSGPFLAELFQLIERDKALRESRSSVKELWLSRMV